MRPRTTSPRTAPARPTSLPTGLLLGLLLGLLGCAGAQDTPPRQAPQATVGAGAPVLWQVERGGAISHVFGTIHVGIDIAELPPVVTERLRQSHTLVVESDLESPESKEATARLLAGSPRESLRAQLTATQWQTLVDALGPIVAPSILDMLPPWLVQTMLTLDEDTLRGGPGLDTQLILRARDGGLELRYLETPEEQLELLAAIVGIDDLRETLDDLPEARRGLQVLLRAYRSGNMAALEGVALGLDEDGQEPEHNERLLYARNRLWMKTLEPLLAQGGVFVAVGAAHYVGDDGLLALLAKAGFRVTRVPAHPPPI